MRSIDPIKPKSELRLAEIKKFKGRLVVQRKYNGCRSTCTVDENGVHLWSRNVSKVSGQRIPYAGKMPHIMKELKSLDLPEGTVLDGELVSFRGGDIENFKDVKQSTGGHDETNVKFQKDTGHWATWIVFDVVYYDGQAVHKLPLKDRLDILESIFEDQELEWIRPLETKPFRRTVQEYEQRALKHNYEGYVVKNIDSAYNYSTTPGNCARPPDTWWKIKPTRVADVIIKGFAYGTAGTKNADKVGKLLCYQYDAKGELHLVCKVGTGFSDVDREELLKLDYDQPLVGMVKYAYRNANHHMIHPAWGGFRDDKAPNECIIEELD